MNCFEGEEILVRAGTWLDDLIEIYNDLGGQSPYRQVYPLARERRLARGASWTTQAEASIRRTVEDHARTSNNFRGEEVFYTVHGHGRGVWALMPNYLRSNPVMPSMGAASYTAGVEGIILEYTYLRRSRDPRLVEERKRIDDYTCQVCDFRLAVGDENYVIDVHHLHPLSTAAPVVITSVEDLVCLCPTCHRVAHSRKERPLTLPEVRDLRSRR